MPRNIVLGGIDTVVEPGAFVCLLGRNGAGKSTLMRTIARLHAAIAGNVILDGEDVAALRPATRAKRIAVVLTERQASPGMTAGDVVALGRAPHTGWAGKLTVEDERMPPPRLRLRARVRLLPGCSTAYPTANASAL